jgi:hypothetical protein
MHPGNLRNFNNERVVFLTPVDDHLILDCHGYSPNRDRSSSNDMFASVERQRRRNGHPFHLISTEPCLARILQSWEPEIRRSLANYSLYRGEIVFFVKSLDYGGKHFFHVSPLAGGCWNSAETAQVCPGMT